MIVFYTKIHLFYLDIKIQFTLNKKEKNNSFLKIIF